METTLLAPELSLTALEAQPEVALTDSHSPLTERLQSPTFRLEWDNEVAFHVARNLLQLRRFRDVSQQLTADTAGTSQGKIARIESGSENITLKTLRRLVEALGGRFYVSISPSELNIPRMPSWWSWCGLTDESKSNWETKMIAFNFGSAENSAAIVWSQQAGDFIDADYKESIPLTAQALTNQNG